MGKIKSFFLNGKTSIIAMLITALVVVGVVYFAYTTDLVALITLAIFLVSAVSSKFSQGLATKEIAECAASFVERSANELRERLSVFAHLSYTVITVEDGGKHLQPRWEWDYKNISGLPVLRLGYLYTGQKRLSEDELHDCLIVLQGMLADDGKRGLLGLPLFPTYADGFPALHLLDIEHDGAYLVFSFVYVDGEKTARKVHEYGAPRWNGDSDDKDF